MDESIISQKFVSIFGHRFDLFPEIHMKHPVSGNDIRIDFIGFDKENYMLGPIGFEIKDPGRWEGDAPFGAFTDALAQCIDYQSRVINSQFIDEKYNQFLYKRPRYTFLFSVSIDWSYNFARSDNRRAWRAGGALRLAGKFGVGAASEENGMMTIGTHRVYTLADGPSDLFHKHSVSNRVGAAR